MVRRADARWTRTFAAHPCQRLDPSGRARRESGRYRNVYRLGARDKVHRSRVGTTKGARSSSSTTKGARTLLVEHDPTRRATP